MDDMVAFVDKVYRIVVLSALEEDSIHNTVAEALSSYTYSFQAS
jgi:hypothetical protein